MKRVLLADDEIIILLDRSRLIESMGYECCIAKDGEEAISRIHNDHPDLILTDIKMPKYDGFDILKEAKKINPPIPVILITGYGTVPLAVQAMENGAIDFIEKPVSPEKFEKVIRKVLGFPNNGSSQTPLKKIGGNHKLRDIVCHSQVMRDLAKLIYKAAQTKANILIHGESGTGKELVAKNIHELSPLSDKPFIPVDCVSLPHSLIESELFGFEKGSFTGATTAKPGLIEIANGGTLFLDEITELDINLQAKLLRVIQERQYRMIGGKHIKKVDIRIISATNRNPEDAVKENLLREDLYYRLNVIPIYVPPLKHRKEDIPLLVEHFIKKFNPSRTWNIRGISKEALNLLMQYHWPGNVRELQNVMHQILSLTENDIIQSSDLPQKIADRNNNILDKCKPGGSFKEAKKEILREFTKEYLLQILHENRGNISKVARISGISRRTVYRMIQELDINC
jgi:two-component system response regulator AtoC